METDVIDCPEDWIARFVTADAATSGGVVRRDAAWVEHAIGRKVFIDAIKAHGFGLLGPDDVAQGAANRI